MDLPALADFDLVATHGGFAAAARATGRPKATLSRRVMELEQSLGVRLFERGRRSLSLTQEGSKLFERTHGLLSEVAEIGEALSAGIETPRGRLRVSAPLLFSHVAMGGLAARFVAKYPQVALEVTADDRPVDLADEGYDLVIRINPGQQEGLVGRRFLRDEVLVVAPPSLKKPRPGGTVPAVVRTEAEGATWKLTSGKIFTPQPVLRLSSMLMVRDAVRAGAGAALMPLSLVAGDLSTGQLVSWGPTSRVEVWALHSSRRLTPSRVRAFVDFLVESYPGERLGTR
jgi:DNA-binding transcriptional LysR family regulator